MDNLPLLKDIHLPDEFSNFPSGYFWFVLLVIFSAAVFFNFSYKWFYLKSKKVYALSLIKKYDENSLEQARNISQVLRRICLLKYKDAASLFGQKWIMFLNQHSRQKITGSAADLLIYAPYVKDTDRFSVQDFQNLKSFAARWIGENL